LELLLAIDAVYISGASSVAWADAPPLDALESIIAPHRRRSIGALIPVINATPVAPSAKRWRR
jgi:hypothetical protein